MPKPNQSHLNLLQMSIDRLDVPTANEEDIRWAVRAVGLVITNLGGRNLDYLEFMAIYGKRDADMRIKLLKKTEAIQRVVYGLMK